MMMMAMYLTSVLHCVSYSINELSAVDITQPHTHSTPTHVCVCVWCARMCGVRVCVHAYVWCVCACVLVCV